MIDSEVLDQTAENTLAQMKGAWRHIQSGEVYRVIDVIWSKARTPEKKLVMAFVYRKQGTKGPRFTQGIVDFQTRFQRVRK